MVMHHNDDADDAAWAEVIGPEPPDDARDWHLVAAAQDELTEEEQEQEAANAWAEYLWEHRPLYRG